MPISNSVSSIVKKKVYKARVKTATATGSVDVCDNENSHKNFLTIGPALPSSENEAQQKPKHLKRSLSTLSTFNTFSTLNTLSSLNTCQNYNEEGCAPVTIENFPDGTVHVLRNQKAKEKNPDRICLDRRGLSAVPIVDGEPQLRLLSLQHNLLSKLDGLHEQRFSFLVFLDVYDNQLDKISSLDTLDSLRVLLMGKNRIKRIEGLQRLNKLEVLDLHGNQIIHVTGLSKLSELKVLNLAGNQIKTIGMSDLKGLLSLQELNLRRNRLKKLLGFGDTTQLQKLFISNNEIQNVEDMSSVAKSVNLREIAIDNNPVSLGGECVSFLVSYLPQLCLLSNMQITEQVRKAAMAWRRNKESSNAAFMDLTSDVCLNVHREEIISNARTNWELLRSQTKCIATTKSMLKDLKIESDFILTPISKPEIKSVAVQRKRISAGSSKISLLPDKKINIIRSSSQDTENSQNTSSSNASNSEIFRLPPILVPIINKLDNSTNIASSSLNNLKRWGSLSSLGPNVDSSSFPSSSSSQSDSESEKEGADLPIQVNAEQTANSLGNTDTSSNISTATSGPTGSSTSGSELSNLSNIPSCRSNTSQSSSKRSIKSATSSRITTKLPGRASTAKPKPKELSPSPPVVQQKGSKDREQGGDYLIELCGRFLNVYGQGALRFIDKPWNHTKANDIHTVKFSYINFNNIVGYFSKLKNRFQNIQTLVFFETNIFCLGQLNALAEVQGFSSLKIEPEGNPIFSKNWRNFAIYRLSHWGLKTINGIEINEEEIRESNEEYESLSDLVLWSLPDILLQPLLARLHVDINGSGENSNISAKKWLCTADPALKSVVSKEALQWRRGSVSQEDLLWRQKARTHMGSLLDTVCQTVEKLRLLDEKWPEILNDLLKEIIVDYSRLDVYMKKKLNELK